VIAPRDLRSLAPTATHGRPSARKMSAVPTDAPAAAEQPMPEWICSDFRFGRRLGKGRFGEVFFVEELKTGRPFAIKVFRKQEFDCNTATLSKLMAGFKTRRSCIWCWSMLLVAL